MSLKLKTLAGLAALAIAGGATGGAMALSTPAAHAATVHCSWYCVTLASQSFGTGQVVAETSSGGVLLAPGYNSAEDFVGAPVGTVSEFVQRGYGGIPSWLAKIYGEEIIYELTYAPFGELKGTCLGVSSLSAGANAVVEPCGAPGTYWIGIYRDHTGDFEPFVNAAASTNSVLVLSATSANGPLTLAHLSLSLGSVASDQLWESLIGVYGQAQPWPTPTGDEPDWPDR
jgi:hypothetical protein